MNYFNSNQNMLNQLQRQRENIDNMINQYQQIPPIQNIINQPSNLEFEARVLKENEDVNNILINRKTMFLDKINKKLYVKELDGSISEEYEIIVPLDEKDKKILELEKRIKEMENEHPKYNKSNNEKSKSNANDNESDESTTTANG